MGGGEMTLVKINCERQLIKELTVFSSILMPCLQPA